MIRPHSRFLVSLQDRRAGARGCGQLHHARGLLLGCDLDRFKPHQDSQRRVLHFDRGRRQLTGAQLKNDGAQTLG